MSALPIVNWLVAATVVFYVLGRFVAAHYRVTGRHLETGRAYATTDLAAWVEADRTRAARYAFPVLIPLDVLFMAALGGAMAAASIGMAIHVGMPSAVAWLFAVLPVAYVAADLVEDLVLARLLTTPRAITEAGVRGATLLTKVKLWTLGLGFLQALILALAGSWFRCN